MQECIMVAQKSDMKTEQLALTPMVIFIFLNVTSSYQIEGFILVMHTHTPVGGSRSSPGAVWTI